MAASIDAARYPRRQQRLCWLCIPAAIENVLVYLGEQGWTQERIFGEWYLWRTGERWYQLGLYKAADGSVWERFLPQRLELESPAKALEASTLGAHLSFSFHQCDSPDEAIGIVRQRLISPRGAVPTIASTAVAGGAHMFVITGYDEDAVRYHDPGCNEFREIDMTTFSQVLGKKPHILLIDRR